MSQDNYPTKIKNQLAEFAIYIKGVRDGTDSTLRAYSHDIDMYFEFLISQEKNLEELHLDERSIRGFVTFLRYRGNSDSTVQRRLDGLYSFWNFLYLEHDYSKPVPVRQCGVRIRKRRNPTQPLSHNDYITFIRNVEHDLRKTF